MPRHKKGTEKCNAENNKWRATMLARFGSKEAMHDFMSSIGRKGGKNGTTGGFYADPVRAKAAGSKGGQRSRRGWALFEEDETHLYYMNRETGKVEKVEK